MKEQVKGRTKLRLAGRGSSALDGKGRLSFLAEVNACFQKVSGAVFPVSCVVETLAKKFRGVLLKLKIAYKYVPAATV